MTKLLIVLLAMALIGLGATACGNATKSTSPASRTPSDAAATGSTPAATVPLLAPQRPGIKDTFDEDDRAPRRLEEDDDTSFENYGRAANAVERQSAINFVKSYFAAAAAENGAAACPLLIPSLANGLGDYEKPPNPSYLSGKTCAEVMTKVFKHRHKLMAKEAAGLEVTAVRIEGTTADVLLAFKGIRERRYMQLERYGGWRLQALTDSSYP